MDEEAEWDKLLRRSIRKVRDDDMPVTEADDLRQHLRKVRLNPVAIALTILHLEDMDPMNDHDIGIV